MNGGGRSGALLLPPYLPVYHCLGDAQLSEYTTFREVSFTLRTEAPSYFRLQLSLRPFGKKVSAWQLSFQLGFPMSQWRLRASHIFSLLFSTPLD